MKGEWGEEKEEEEEEEDTVETEETEEAQEAGEAEAEEERMKKGAGSEFTVMDACQSSGRSPFNSSCRSFSTFPFHRIFLGIFTVSCWFIPASLLESWKTTPQSVDLPTRLFISKLTHSNFC